ncbi:MAG: NUDIX domain-containing protein [Candidatus Nomurabacteria bacterium]|nr:NUDIX domain-containing protein [Candidatus Nomurabacteria bacterium]
MKICTLGFLFRNGKIILAQKKRKIGVGKWNGYGGKMEGEESRIDCLIRETLDECGVVLQKEDCNELGYIDFFLEDRKKLNQRVFIYRVNNFSGEPKESEEMGEPREFNVNELPYNEMMAGDDKFMTFVIKIRKFRGEIHFLEKENRLVSSNVIEITDEKNEIKLR